MAFHRLPRVAARKLRVMPDIEVPPEDVTILEPQTTPAIRGEGKGKGPETLLCGSCEAILVQDVFPGTLGRAFIRCPRCGAMNASE